MLDSLNIKGIIITTNAIGTQTEIVKKIRHKYVDYMLALKGNQEICWKIWESISRTWNALGKAPKKRQGKSKGKMEKREYWQTDDILWLNPRKE
ncbi:MAG: transposase [Lachnospiraceae bacterium]|nr:transposase [Lachnospiraceae bacterium]